ncbi:hypothetical protein V8C86DRAFT_2496940 [Haematococcus lacustris]
MIRWRRDNLTVRGHSAQPQSFRTIPRAAEATSGMLCNTVAKPFASAGSRTPVRAAWRVRAAEPEFAAEPVDDRSYGRRDREDRLPEFKQFLPLPKPAHLIFVKPTVAVVAGMASRSSVGLRMTAGDQQLERYVIEFYSKSVK